MKGMQTMEIYDKLTTVFSSKWFEIRHTGDCYNIVEEDKGASVKNAKITYHGKLMSINKEIFNKTDSLLDYGVNYDKAMDFYWVSRIKVVFFSVQILISAYLKQYPILNCMASALKRWAWTL